MQTNETWDLIIIGLGDLGSRVAEMQSAKNRSVLGMRRSVVSRNYSTLAIDIHSKQFEQLNLKCKCLLYSVAANDRSEAGYRLAYPEGLARVQNHISADHIIYIGSTSVYDEQDTNWIDENTLPNPTGFAGKALSEAENLLGSTDCTVHLGGIYGPGRDRLIRLAKSGTWCKTGHLTNRIHIEDAASICSLLISRVLNQQDIPQRILGVDGEGVDMATLLEWLRVQNNTKISISEEIAYSDTGKRCRSILLKDLGFEFKYPDFKRGYKPLMSTEE